MARTSLPFNETEIRLAIERNLNVSENPARARGHQEAAVLPHRDRGQPLAARWPLHRAAWLFQSAAAERKDRAAQDRSGQGESLARQGRGADRPRAAVP